MVEEKVEVKEENTEIKPEVKPEAKPEVDLVTRVSQVKPKEKESGFDIRNLDSEIEKVENPQVKEQLLGLKKSLISGENKKYEQIAELRKQYEQKLSEFSSWTPERVKKEMGKPDFIEAAQTVLGENQNSALSEEDNKELKQLRQKIDMLQNSTWQAQKAAQDAQLKQKYANYAPDIIDTVTADLINNRRTATREDLWKAIDYDNAVNRAYQLGLSDKIAINQEKAVGITPVDGSGNVTTSPTLERQKGESVQQFMVRSYQTHQTKK